MLNIKAIFFDFDGVLTTNESAYKLVPDNIYKYKPGINYEKMLECYLANRKDLQAGIITHEDIWKDLCKCAGTNMNYNIMEKVFLDTPMNGKMLVLASHLKNDYILGIITNNTSERINTLSKEHGLYKLFDPIIVSSAIGKTKNGPDIFNEALKKHGLRPEDSVFIDNQEKNLMIPKEMGFKTYLHDPISNNVEILREELKDWGIKIN